VGIEVKLLEKGLGSKFSFFDSTEGLLSGVDPNLFANDLILITGARSFGFERIVNRLQQRVHGTSLEINLNALTHNLNFYKQKLNPTTKVMVMVKAFAYGGGAAEIANHLQTLGVDYLAVAFTDEGVSLRKEGIRLPIMVLNPAEESFYLCQEFDLEPVVFSISFYQSLAEWCMNQDSSLKIHLDLDTGMHRLGFEEDTIDELITTLKGNETVEIKSILSHLATSDDLKHREFTVSQISLFDKLSSKIASELGINPIRHILNTSGISNFPDAQYNMVRLGIGLYGVSNDPSEQKYLENVGTLKSVISQIRTIAAGESVGYGRKFMAEKPTKIGTIPIGYADGISRAWGNGVGFVTIKDKKAKILGSICMDMLMVDVTEIDCTEGDSVIIFGESPTVSYIAKKINTIAYEVLTSISQRVKRVFYR
jgi:alanine racemase